MSKAIAGAVLMEADSAFFKEPRRLHVLWLEIQLMGPTPPALSLGYRTHPGAPFDAQVQHARRV